jgi:alkanesulfonate monooxygenase SsuD/methylene tetrahydromethanopterin reductase-like flavin-dependent oxidoreductase (luciferase family)
MTRSTLDTGRQAAAHIARGAQRAGRQPQDIDIASLLPCSIASNRQAAFDAMRPGVAFYAGFFPRYNRLMVESGFAEVAEAIHTAWAQGDQAGATRAVPDALIAATGVVGMAAECRTRLAAYRHSGIALPIISPLSRGPQGKQRAIAAIKACAP